MNLKYVSIIAFAFCLISVFPSFNISHASQPAMGAKGNRYLKVIETAKILNPDDTLLVWIDINATVDSRNDYWLPADPSVYGIKWVTITLDPDMKHSKLFWSLAEIQAQKAENLIKIPWIFDITLVNVGGFGAQASPSLKLSVGLQETVDRALQRNGTLQVILWIENSAGSIKKANAVTMGIEDEILENVTTTIGQLGGKLSRDYYVGSHTLSATLPPQNISRIVQNSFIKKIYLNGPIILEGVDNTTRLYGFSKIETSIELHDSVSLVLFLSALVVSFATAKSDKKAKKKLLTFLCAVAALSLTFMSQMTPSAYALDVSKSAIKATEVWETGNRGAGVNVAIIDTGIDPTHNDFPQGVIVDGTNIPDPTEPIYDYAGHGTTIAGIVAGRGINNPNYRGVAPDAGLVVVRAVYDDDLEPAVRWIIDHRTQDKIRVIQSSVCPSGVGRGGDGLDSPYSIALDDAIENGIVVVQAAGDKGNEGSKTVESPGNAFNVITVGAVNDMGTDYISDDELAYYPNGYTYKGKNFQAWGSAKGPTGDGRPKPDVVAPGVHIWSTMSFYAGASTQGCEDWTTDWYIETSGASVAAPHVSGTVALMLNANPNLTAAQVKAILRQTARLNTNLNGLTVNERGHGIINAYAAVQLAQNVNNTDKYYMYDSWDVKTPDRYLDIFHTSRDYLTFTVEYPHWGFGTATSIVKYHYSNPFWRTDYTLLTIISAAHIWIDYTYYDLGTDMHRYLFSGPRIYEKGDGYVLMRALYRVGGSKIVYQWKMDVDEMWLKLIILGTSSYRALIYIDPDVWGSANYAKLPSTNTTVLTERNIYGDVLLDVRHENHTEHLEIDPVAADNPRMWVLKSGYYGNNPDSALNGDYVFNRDIVIYYQATSYAIPQPDPGPNIRRKPNPPDTPDTSQDDARTRGDAGNNFNDATRIFSGTYKGILSESDPEDSKDWYKFYARNEEAIRVDLQPPVDIDFDLELYDPQGNLKAASYEGAGYLDSVTYSADSEGYWRARINRFSGEAEYEFSIEAESASGGGCPILYVYNGGEYVSEGLLDIHDPNGTDVITKHTLVTAPEQTNGEYLFRLTEHPKTISHIDQVKFYAILKDKTLLELPLTWAIHSEHGNVLQQLLLSDEWKTETLGADWNNGTSQSIDLKFQALPSNIKPVGFIFQIEGNNMIQK